MGSEIFLEKAFEHGILVGFMALIIVALCWFLMRLYNELKDERLAKENVLRESLGMIKMVETQLTDNKTSNTNLKESVDEVLTEIKLVKEKLS